VSQDKTIKIWNLQTLAIAHILSRHAGSVRTVAFSPDGSTIATGSNDHTIKLWNASTGALICTLEGHTNLVNAVAFSRDGKTLASGSEDKTIKVWDLASGSQPLTLTGSSTVTSVAFDPKKPSFVSGANDGMINLVTLTQSPPTIPAN
jgi:WD40 repeat protein